MDRTVTASSWRGTVRQRAIVCVVGTALWTAGIEARLVYLQVYDHGELQERAQRQQMRTIAAPPKRGDILDRNGHVLAYSVDGSSIYAVPNEISDAEATAATVCAALEECSSRERRTLAEKLRRRSAFAFVRRQVSPADVERIARLNPEGIGFLKESQRFYPKRELAAQLLGFVGVDNVGLAGLEAAYDARIRGKPGAILIQTDAHRRAFSRLERPPTVGATIELTIDEYLQHIAERELRAGVRSTGAAGGMAIVMEPFTGEILALANEPTFNPHDFATALDDQKRNRAVQDIYEPGSTFKVVTASAALQERIVRLNEHIDASGGRIRLGTRVVSDTHDYGAISFTDVIVKSSNVGAIRVGLRLGSARLGEYVRRFGFGSRLSPDFPAETSGIVWDPNQMNDGALASVSMGYQVGVTALQMVTAVSSVANGGSLMEPHVVRAVMQDGRRVIVRPRKIRSTITTETAAALTGIMEAVVDRGTGIAAQIPGYTIAGKTGTATKLVNGHYSHTDYNASFVGFLPSRKPALAIIVVIDSPRRGSYYGSVVAAPVFRRIAEASLQQLGISPTLNAPPPVLIDRHAAGPANVAVHSASTASVVTIDSRSEPAALPDFTGLSAREVVQSLTRIGMTAKLQGEGFVVAQRPAPGSPIQTGAACEVQLARR